MAIEKKGMMFVLSSPSGAGKTTLTKKLAANNNNLSISISHTTRKPRPNEVNGKDYFFVSNSKFEKLIVEKKFFEHANIFENNYGTLKQPVEDLIRSGKDVLFDIDWQGTQQLSKFKNLRLIKIYLIPPNKDELKKRLIKRNQDSPKEVERRFKAYDKDIHHWKDYDYIIINKNLENCYKQIENIILTNKNKSIKFSQKAQ